MMTFTLPIIFTNLLLFLIRILLAVTFFTEARTKFRDIKGFAKNDGVPVPVAYFVGIAESAAALGMLTGVLAQWAGIGLILLMLSTIGLHVFKWHSPYWATKRGWEYDLLMLVLAATITVFGTGAYTLF